MSILDKISRRASRLSESLATIAKVCLLSRKASSPASGEKENKRTLVILGNGPSLRGVLDNPPAWLADTDRMAVNFAANTDMFRSMRPERYVLADPHFFGGEKSDPNVKRLWENLRGCDWPMTLHIPVKEAGRARAHLAGNTRIILSTFNMTPGEGWPALTHPLFDAGLAMPRPRNVMIPAVMEGIRAGYHRILLAGADHSWLQSLYVDDDNMVVSVQPHFYADNDKEKERVRSEYAGYHLHDILGSMTVAFRSYHEIAAYAAKRGVTILNATPGSYIDAFPRLR